MPPRSFLSALIALGTALSLVHGDSRLPERIDCEGTYPKHLQGVATDGKAIYWSWTTSLVKTNFSGKIIKSVPADDHQGDLCVVGGKVYVAVNLGKFNQHPGKAISLVYVYDSTNLNILEKHPVPEVVHGAGAIAEQNGKFIIAGGLPPDLDENYLYEYDKDFRFIQRHTLASGYTKLGIQTATYSKGAWWFGCYGSPEVVLRADRKFQLTGRWEFKASVGLEGMGDGRFLLGRNVRREKGYHGWVEFGREDKETGLRAKAH